MAKMTKAPRKDTHPANGGCFPAGKGEDLKQTKKAFNEEPNKKM